MRKCRKCENVIPNSITINGQRKILSNRKFCLKCSPWGMNNRKVDDPARPTQTKYRDWSPEKRKLHCQRVLAKARKRRNQLLELRGGSCELCNYSRCNRALTFHHRCPEEKSFGLNVEQMMKHPWEELLTEIAKCQLVCFNCHMEIEDAIRSHKV
jgi:predicted Zn-ribbon and HTH transcriptional regulator